MRWVILREFDDGTHSLLLEMNPDFVKGRLADAMNMSLGAKEAWNKRSFNKDEVATVFSEVWDKLASEFKAKTVTIR